MRLVALEVTLEAIRALRSPLLPLRSRDPKLYEQIRRAASSVALNLAEGQGRRGKDRQHFWRIALGSAREVEVALRVAVAWGDLRASAVADSVRLLERVSAMLWRLTN